MRDPDVVKPFHFDEHILPLEGKLLEHFARYTFWFGSLFCNRKEWRRIVLESYKRNLDLVSGFFTNMEERGYCNQSYEVFNPKYCPRHRVRIWADKKDTFDIEGRPVFLEDGKTEIPVHKNGDTFNLILFQHPQQDIIPGSRLNVFYQFQVTLSLGEAYATNPKFTRNVRKLNSSGFVDSPIPFWFGEPGRIYYRPGDAFGKELSQKILGVWDGGGRTHFYMSGTVYQNGDFLYNGKLDSTGTFPFYLREQKDREGDRETGLVPICGATV